MRLVFQQQLNHFIQQSVPSINHTQIFFSAFFYFALRFRPMCDFLSSPFAVSRLKNVVGESEREMIPFASVGFIHKQNDRNCFVSSSTHFVFFFFFNFQCPHFMCAFKGWIMPWCLVFGPKFRVVQLELGHHRKSSGIRVALCCVVHRKR